ncbi:MAG TPA: GMC family oxidoreductase, partial [Blastocatellia bacterium]|nr:GMC family oxidoreductase [Blastocatellia bacterium]
DVIVIGSGFGGAISACRLAEAGYKVLILERGRRWDKNTYPSVTNRDWIWSNEAPELLNGWSDLRVFPNMSVIQGAAVGGGSLIYANISAEAKPDIFKSPWPPEITYDELKPYYAAVAKFMNVQKVPENQWPERTRLMREAAHAINEGQRFGLLDLAVSFDPNISFAPDDPPPDLQSRTFINAQGRQQGYCTHLGVCDAGCPVDAKNTLDLTYIAQAENHGAEVRPLHIVKSIAPVSGGYNVSFDRLETGRRIAGNETARIVIVAAGSLGSTELLFRCRDEHKTLPNISSFLGHHWSSNGDFLTPALYPHRKINVSPSKGPTITSAIDFLDRSQEAQSFWIEDGGTPDLLGYYLESQFRRSWFGRLHNDILVNFINQSLQRRNAFRHIMPWFAQGVDAADGQLKFARPWYFFGARRFQLQWDITKSKPVFDAIVRMHRKLSAATGGAPLVSPSWTVFQDLLTPHPLGGCNLGTSAANGVVAHTGEVFGYQNLFVADAAIIPTALGVNPSRTIGALAERVADLIQKAGR